MKIGSFFFYNYPTLVLNHRMEIVVISQIETKIIFSLAGIVVTNLMRCCLKLYNLKRLIFVNKNWPNDANVSCKVFPSLEELIKFKVYL